MQYFTNICGLPEPPLYLNISICHVHGPFSFNLTSTVKRHWRIFTPPDTINYPTNPGRFVENIFGLCLQRLVKMPGLRILVNEETNKQNEERMDFSCFRLSPSTGWRPWLLLENTESGSCTMCRAICPSSMSLSQRWCLSLTLFPDENVDASFNGLLQCGHKGIPRVAPMTFSGAESWIWQRGSGLKELSRGGCLPVAAEAWRLMPAPFFLLWVHRDRADHYTRMSGRVNAICHCSHPLVLRAPRGRYSFWG